MACKYSSPPRSPFSTRLSGSARETELRIRSIFQWKKKRPPVWLMASVGAAILLCGSLVSCQSRPPEVSLTMDVQYYDALSNYIEIPALTVSGTDQPSQGVTAINQALAQLKADYQPVLEGTAQTPGETHCLLYPAETDRYLSLVFFREEYRTDLCTGHVTSLVYDKESETQLTLDQALGLAGQTEEGLCQALAEQYAPILREENPGADVCLQSQALEGFRMGPDGQPVFYLTARTDDRDDSVQDMVSGCEDLYIWQGGSFTRYDQYNVTDLRPLVPEEECRDLTPPLWRQWYFAGEEPEGGWNPVPVPDSVRNTRLLQRTMEHFDPYYGTSQSTLLSVSSGPRALMLVESADGPHADGLDNLVLGVWDEDAQDFAGDSYLIGGDNGLYSTWEEEGALWLLCSNSTTYQGDETCSGLGLFRFADGELERILTLPQAALDSGVLPDTEEARSLLHPLGDSGAEALSYDFWLGRLAIPGAGGFDLYEKNPAWSSLLDDQPQWLYQGFVPLSGQTAAPLPGGDPRVRSCYASLLENVLLKRPLSGALRDLTSSADTPSTPSQLGKNKFAVCDVDGDGREELLLSYRTTITAGQGTYVLDYRADMDTLLLQSPDKLGLEPTFYENGTVLAPSLHNQGWGGRFWPYSVYRYDSRTDSYSYAGSADAWDREISDQNPDFRPFPEELDVSGSGFLYYLDGDDTPVDEAVYLRWLEGHTGGTAPLPVEWLALTQQNISRLLGGSR